MSAIKAHPLRFSVKRIFSKATSVQGTLAAQSMDVNLLPAKWPSLEPPTALVKLMTVLAFVVGVGSGVLPSIWSDEIPDRIRKATLSSLRPFSSLLPGGYFIKPSLSRSRQSTEC